MKKLLSILLVFASLTGMCGIAAQAVESDSAYPESEHDYQNDYRNSWYYTHPEEAEGLFVTFSEDTYTEIGFEEYIPEEDDWNYKTGDRITVYRGEHSEWLGTFCGNELASKTIYIPDSSFKIELVTDESVTAYGFKVERIDTTLPEGISAICYNFEQNESGVDKFYDCYVQGETVPVANEIFSAFADCNDFRNGCEYRCGWSTSPDGELVYEDGEKIITDETVLNLYGSWVSLLISADEVYGFSNDDYDFNVEPIKPGAWYPSVHYYMTPEDHSMLLRNALRNGLPGWICYKSLKEYPQKDFQGACFGMASTVFLQYHGAIDMLSLQEGAESMRELEPTPEVLSAVNYYQSLTIMSFLCQNQAPEVGSEAYKKQLKNLFETVSEGKPALLSVLGDNYIFGFNHTALVTGAYTDKQGNHHLLAYNDWEGYAENTIKDYVISPDFSSFNDGSTFYWTDDYSHLESLDINGKGSPIKWYLEFIPQIPALLKMLVQQLLNLLKQG